MLGLGFRVGCLRGLVCSRVCWVHKLEEGFGFRGLGQVMWNVRSLGATYFRIGFRFVLSL